MLRDRKLPQLSVDLIDELDKMFPARCIEAGQTLEAANRYAGKRDLIDYLRALRDEANATDKILR